MFVPVVTPFSPNRLVNVSGYAVTFITPGGCNLACPHCAVAQRGERNRSTVLAPADYARFVTELAALGPLQSVAMAGDEPLMDVALEYTLAVMHAARKAGVPGSLVTNGFFLERCVNDLEKAEVDSLIVSLDGIGESHDRTRRTKGAFEAARQGIARATANPYFRGRIIVASLLQSGKLDFLDRMPEFLHEMSIGKWLLSPKLFFGTDTRKADCDKLSPEEIDRLADLMERAGMRYGIETYVDGETSLNPSFGLYVTEIESRLPYRRFGSNLTLLRMLPDGTCSINADIFRNVVKNAPKWDGKQPPHEFVESLTQSSVELRKAG